MRPSDHPTWWAPSRFYFATGRLIGLARSRELPAASDPNLSLHIDSHQNPIEANTMSWLVGLLTIVAFGAAAFELPWWWMRMIGLLLSPIAVVLFILAQLIVVWLGVVTLRMSGWHFQDDVRIQGWSQLILYTVDSAFLAFRGANVVLQAVGWCWLILAALNGVAAIILLLRRSAVVETNRRLIS